MKTNNNHPQSFITKCFYAAALYNILGSAVFSKFLTNDYMASLDPDVFSDMGWTVIFLLGFAYLSIAKSYHNTPYTSLVFFVVKMLYVATWAIWLLKNGSNLAVVYNTDLLTGIGFTIYGFGDLIFGLFFLWVATKFLNKK